MLQAVARWRVIAGVVCLTGATVGVLSQGVRAVVRLSPLPADFSLTGGAQRVPPSFFGLSVEYNQLSLYEGKGHCSTV